MTAPDLPFDPSAFTWLTFDCYGTLVDWERGIVKALTPVLAARGVVDNAQALLEHYARFESDLEKGEYIPYRELLSRVVDRFGMEYGFTPTAQERASLPASLPGWPPFDDTVEALGRLKSRWKLGVISNTDPDLFAGTRRALGVEFDGVYTAAEARAYKPSRRMFEGAFAAFGVRPDEALHVAQSRHHDIAPARELGMRCVWVDRRAGQRFGTGATVPSAAEPDLRVPDLRTLVSCVL